MRRRTDLAAVALLAFIVLALWSDVLVGNRALYARDVARVYVPERAVLREILRNGELPLWNPHYGGGQPLAANPAYEAFYPPQWLVLLPDLLLGIHLEIVLHILLAALGMYAFLRAMDLSPAAAFFGALSLALGGLVLSTVNLLPFLFSLSWWPWIGLFVRRRQVAAAALAFGLMALAAEQSMILMTAALVAALCLVWHRRLVLAIAVGAGAFAVAAVQLVPALDFQRDSGRAVPLTFVHASNWTMSAIRPLELVLPSAFGRYSADAVYFWGQTNDPTHVPWLFSWYGGLLAAALAVAGFIHRIRGWKFAAAAFAASYIFAVLPLHYWLGLRSIRYPEKFFLAGAFVLLVFAALAAQQFLDDARFRRTTFFVAIALTAVAAAAIAFAWSPLFARAFGLRGYVADILGEARSGALTTLASATALALILAFRERRRLVVPLLGLFVLADLGARTWSVAPRIGRDFYDPPALARELPRGARLYNDAAWRVDLLPQPRIAYADRWPRLRNAMFPELQALWGFDSVLELDVTKTMLLPTQELSVAFWRAQFSRRSDEARRILAAAGVTHVVALRDATSATNPAAVVPLPGNARFTVDRGHILAERQTANRVELEVDAAAPARVTIRVTRHRYWRATVDGKPAPIVPANIAFQAVDVPAGRHRVELRYQNTLVTICGIVSLLSALGLAAAALRSRALPPPSPR